MALTNPYNFGPALGEHFAGREDIQQLWLKQLEKSQLNRARVKGWWLVGPIGTGKTSLLHKLAEIAGEKYQADVILVDQLGQYVRSDSPEAFFNAVDKQLWKAQGVGQKGRQALGLKEDASAAKVAAAVGLKLAGMVLRSGIPLSFAPSEWNGLGFGANISSLNLEKKTFQSAIVTVFSSILKSIAILSQSKKHPVVLLVDDLGEVVGNSRWEIIAETMLLFFAKMIETNFPNFMFVAAVRPEHRVVLESLLNEESFNSFYEYIEVGNLSEADGVKALTQFGAPHDMPEVLAKRIIGLIAGQSGDVDPFTMRLAARAVWKYQHRGAVPKSSRELLQSGDLERVISESHSDLIKQLLTPQRKLDWLILQRLAADPAGLDMGTLKAELASDATDMLFSGSDVEKALATLLKAQETTNGVPHRLLIMKDPGEPSEHYVIAHNLLRQYILKQAQDDQAQKMLDAATRSFNKLQYAALLLNSRDLVLLWDHRASLRFPPKSWHAIAAAGLQQPEQLVTKWCSAYKDDLSAALRELPLPVESKDMAARLLLLRYHFNSDSAARNDYLALIIQHAEADELRLNTVRALLDSRHGGPLALSPSSIELILNTLDHLARHSPDAAIQEQAARALGEVGAPALAVLTGLAQSDHDRGVRAQAVAALGDLGQVAALTLNAIVDASSDEYLLLAVAKALGVVGETGRAINLLNRLVSTSKDERGIHLAAADGLSELGAKDAAAKVFENVARNSRNPQAREQAVSGLSRLGDETLDILLDLAQNTGDEKVRLVAAAALPALGDAQTALETWHDLARNSRTEPIRLQAIAKLAELRNRAKPYLHSLADGANAASIRLAAAKALIALGEQPVQPLIELAGNADPLTLRLSAIQDLCQVGRPDEATAALRVLSHSTSATDMLLGIIGVLRSAQRSARYDSQAIELFSGLAARNSLTGPVRLRATEALYDLGKTDVALAALDDLARGSSDPGLQVQIAKTEIRFGVGTRPIERLEAWTHNGDVNIRIQAAAALGELGKKLEAALLLRELALQAELPEARLLAVVELAKLGADAADPLYFLAVHSPDNVVRLRAAKWLGQIHQLDLELLKNLVSNASDSKVRHQALDTLFDHGAAALQILAQIATNSNDDEIRRAAALAPFSITPIDYQALYQLALATPLSGAGPAAAITFFLSGQTA